MFKNLLNPENGLMITVSRITDAIFLSLFWIIGCIPVVTLGASTAALYDSSFRAFRKGDPHSWQRFFSVFRRNWKAGILPSLVYIAVFAAGARGLIAVWNAAVCGQTAWVAFCCAAAVGLVVLGVLSVLFPLLSRFKNSFTGLLKNAALLAMANMPRTLALGVVNAAAIYLCVRYVFPLFFLPGVAAVISTWLLEPMFRPYMPEDPDAL